MNSENKNGCVCQEHGLPHGQVTSDAWVNLPQQIDTSIFVDGRGNETTDISFPAEGGVWVNTGKFDTTIQCVPQKRLVCMICGWISSLDVMVEIFTDQAEDFLKEFSEMYQSWVKGENPFPPCFNIGPDGRIEGWEETLKLEIEYFETVLEELHDGGEE